MGVGQLPTKTDGENPGEIGRVVDDRPRALPPDPRFEIIAAKHERLKDQVIENASAIGTTVTPAAPSLEARLAALEAAPAAIFEWNKIDLTQFDTGNLLTFEETLGGGPSGTMSPTFEITKYKNEPVIRLSANNILGGSVLTILPGAFTSPLPRRYRIVAHLVGVDTASLSALVCPFGNADGVQWRGVTWKRTAGGSAGDLELTTDEAGTQRLRTPIALPPTLDTWNQSLEDRGGGIYTIECLRQDGDAAPDFFVKIVAQEAGQNDAGAVSRQDATGANDVTPDWDSEDMSLIGIGALSESSGRTGDIDFLDLKVFPA